MTCVIPQEAVELPPARPRNHRPQRVPGGVASRYTSGSYSCLGAQHPGQPQDHDSAQRHQRDEEPDEASLAGRKIGFLARGRRCAAVGTRRFTGIEVLAAVVAFSGVHAMPRIW